MTAARVAPAVARNRAAIADVLQAWLPQPGKVVEIASGSGEHAVYFCTAMPGLTWQPTDRDAEAIASITAWRAQAALPNLLAPVRLDAAAADWPVAQVDAVVAINMIHIAPWAATLGLMAGAARALTAGGLLYLYGPYREDGRHTADSNAAFDADLQARNPDWGVRDLGDVAAAAAAAGLALAEVIVMPANNRSVMFRKL